MGVFYNPQGPMPIAQMGFQTQIGGATGGGGSRRQPKEVKRDLAAEKADAWKQASIVGNGDPIKTADAMSTLGYPDDAAKYKHQVAQTEEQNLKVEEMETMQEVEQLRIGADLLRSGREDLAIRVANKAIPEIENQLIRMKYDPKKDTVAFETHAGDEGSMKVEDLIKAGTSSEKQFTEMAAYKRTLLSTMKDPKTLSVAERTSLAYGKMGNIELAMGKGASYDEVIKLHPEWALLPHEEELVAKDLEGNPSAVIAAIATSNPSLLKVWGFDTPEKAAKFIVDINTISREKYTEARKKRLKPKAGEPNAGSTPPTSKTGEKTSISVTERSHPAFKPPEGAVFGKGKTSGRDVYTTDGGKTVFDAQTGEQVK